MPARLIRKITAWHISRRRRRRRKRLQKLHHSNMIIIPSPIQRKCAPGIFNERISAALHQQTNRIQQALLSGKMQRRPNTTIHIEIVILETVLVHDAVYCREAALVEQYKIENVQSIRQLPHSSVVQQLAVCGSTAVIEKKLNDGEWRFSYSPGE